MEIYFRFIPKMTRLTVRGGAVPIFYCLPTIRIVKDPGAMGPRAGRPAGPGGAPGGGGSNRADIVKR